MIMTNNKEMNDKCIQREKDKRKNNDDWYKNRSYNERKDNENQQKKHKGKHEERSSKRGRRKRR